MRTLSSFALSLVALSAPGFAQDSSSLAAAVEAAPGPQIAYQGRLLEAALPVTGMRSFIFTILDATGTELWNSGPQNVSISNGLYAVVLGGTGMPAIPPALLTRANLKLRLSIGGTLLTPDTDLVSAFQSRSSWEVTGAFAGDVTGTQNAMRVVGLQGFPVDLGTAPTSGQVLAFNGTKWTASSVAGTPGPQGPTGPEGPMGPTGTGGVTGATGPAGPKGATGVAGPAGAAGPIGPLGPQGAIGATGPIGPQGALGATGSTGATGPQGISTYTWQAAYNPALTYQVNDVVSYSGSSYVAVNAIGAGNIPSPVSADWKLIAQVGAQGVTGAQGPIGPTGAVGATGAAGPTGAIGPQGPIGTTGATGAVGPLGPAGTTGPTGPQGPSVYTWKGTWSGSTMYRPNDVVSYQGSSYVAGFEAMMWPGMPPTSPIFQSFPNAWTLIAAKGDTGATGASGGRTLLGGAADPQAADGSDGDFWLNTTTSTMFGPKASGAWPAGWSIKGATGDTGPQGPIGTTGATGATGAFGATGPTGAQGPQGLQGPAGSGAFSIDVATGAATYSGGDVGIGTTSPTAKLHVQGSIKIMDGTQGAGNILTSDVNGLASWTPLTAAYYAYCLLGATANTAQTIVLNIGSGITVSSSTTIIIPANKVYLFTASLQLYNFDETQTYGYRLYNATSLNYLGNTVYWGNPNGAGTKIGTYVTQSLNAVIKPTVDTSIQLVRATGAAGPALTGTLSVVEIK